VHQWSSRGALQSGVTGRGSQTQYLSACGTIPGTSFRSPEGNAKAICDPPLCTASWHTCPAGAAHRKVTVCWALAAVARLADAARQNVPPVGENPAYQELLASGRLDQCGTTLLAGKAVGAPFVGSVAACLAIPEVLRLLARL
jgi:hypothetical protein